MIYIKKYKMGEMSFFRITRLYKDFYTTENVHHHFLRCLYTHEIYTMFNFVTATVPIGISNFFLHLNSFYLMNCQIAISLSKIPMELVIHALQ